MHPVLIEIIDTNGLKRAGAHMQGDIRDLRTLSDAALHHGGIEMQSGRGRCDRAGLARVHRLIADWVVGVGRSLDIRRQGHCAMPLEILQRIGAQLQLEQIVMARDESSLDAARQQHRHLVSQRLAGVNMGKNAPTGENAFEQDLHLAARGLDAEYTRRNDACVVEYEQISGSQQRREIQELTVEDGSRTCFQMQQPAARTLRCGALCNQLRRKLIIEVAAPHRARKVADRNKTSLGPPGAGSGQNPAAAALYCLRWVHPLAAGAGSRSRPATHRCGGMCSGAVMKP